MILPMEDKGQSKSNHVGNDVTVQMMPIIHDMCEIIMACTKAIIMACIMATHAHTSAAISDAKKIKIPVFVITVSVIP